MAGHVREKGIGLARRGARAWVARLSPLLVIVACTARESTAPVQLAVSSVFTETDATCDFAYQCTETVRYVTTDLSTGRNVPGEVAISGAGTHPPTAMSGPLGVGDFTWTFPAEPGTHQITVCPNVPMPLTTRCRTMDVDIAP